VAGVCQLCDPSWCKGCCSDGQCVAGTTADACGAHGGQCQACPANSACIASACSAGEIVLFGGQAGVDGMTLGDTWTFDGATWSAATAAGPPARRGHAMTTFESTVVLFGGEGTGGSLGDTWTYDGSRWTQSSAAGPPARSGHAMTTVYHRAAVFGGRATAPGTDGGASLLGDTWAYDGTTWALQSVRSTPSARYGSAIAVQQHTLTGYGVLFGGLAADGLQADVWELWPLMGGTWASYTATGPSPRSGHAMATLGTTAADNGVVLFGGRDATGALLGDTWVFVGQDWVYTAISGPPPRSLHAMAALRGLVVLYGGVGENGALDDTWSFDGKQWTQVATSGPPARQGHAMAGLP
jgi:hypothetical protein